MIAMPALGYNDVRRKPSGKYEARWADHQCVLRSKSFLLEATARQYARDQAILAEEIFAGKRAVEIPILKAVESFQTRPNIKANTVAVNQRTLDAFVTRHNLVNVSQLADVLPDKEHRLLVANGHNSGGQNHVLKLLKCFVGHCVDKKWLTVSPFPRKFKLPKSDFVGRALSEDEFEKMIAIRANVDCIQSDTWMRRWLILQRYTLTRISTICDLTSASFRQDGTEMLIPDLKHQGKVWAEVTHPEALAVVQELLQYARPGERLFRHWKDAAAMREAFRCKARLAGLTYQENGRFIPLRPHDACKVTEVTSLDERGATLGQISAVSNTTADTLSKHYLKPDRKRAFQRVREIYARTTHRPQAGDFKPVSAGPIDQNSFKARDKNRQVSDEECAA